MLGYKLNITVLVEIHSLGRNSLKGFGFFQVVFFPSRFALVLLMPVWLPYRENQIIVSISIIVLYNGISI